MTVYIIYYTYKMCIKIVLMCFINISYLFISSANASLHCQAEELGPATH